MSGIAIISTLLKGDVPVVAVTTAAGIYPIEAPQDAQGAFIVLNQTGGKDGLHLGGQDEYPLHRIMVECNALTAADAFNLGELVLDALRNTIKAVVGNFKDVDVTECGPQVTDYSDGQQYRRRILQFYVRFRRRS